MSAEQWRQRAAMHRGIAQGCVSLDDRDWHLGLAERADDLAETMDILDKPPTKAKE